jgi:hypothetical protein
MKLLICGSRQATPEMLRLAYNAVLRAKTLGWEIVVGDADGVDKQVLYACCWNEVPFHIYGCSPAPRHSCCTKHATENYTAVSGKYFARDRHMCKIADRCLAIWNGSSRGTKYTFDHMKGLGKQADLRTFHAK